MVDEVIEDLLEVLSRGAGCARFQFPKDI